MPPDPVVDATPEQQLRQACAELERRLRAGEPCCAEDLLAAFPALAAHTESALELIYTEFVLRQEMGQRPSPTDWPPRFPQWQTDLEQLFEVHECARSTSVTPPAGSMTSRAGDPGQPTWGTGSEGARRLGNYELLEEIGRGGMGVVYRARQAGLNRVVALKVILADVHATPQDVSRFRREAEAVARLQHPHIVQIYEVGEQAGRPYFSLEYVEGGNLEKKLAGTPLPARQAAELVETLARTMHHAHQQGIIHRDLKPANVLLTAAGVPKVTDFGLAKRLEGGVGATQSGAIVGTPSYMAPEQAAGRSKGIGPAADVYALGAILYEALTGRPPFKAATPWETVLQVLGDDAVPPRQFQPKVPRDLETVCLKCLQKEPRQRYASAADLAEDLRRFLAGEPVRARPVGRGERVVKWMVRHPAVAAVYVLLPLVLLLSSGGAAVAWLWQRAVTAQGQAEVARTQAEVAQGQAEEAGRLAVIAQGEAEQARRDLDRVLYVQRVARAFQEWRDNQVGRANELLGECPPALRQWEWRYVYRLCHADLFTCNGHTGVVQGVCWSPDGKRLASAGNDMTVKVWDAERGQEVLTLKGHTKLVTSVCWSPDGTRLASASADQTVKVWDLERHQPALSLEGHTSLVYSVCWSPDGTRLASASADKTVKVWDLERRQECFSLKGPSGAVSCVCWSPDGKRLASASTDQTLQVWDLERRPHFLTLQGHTQPVSCVSWSPDGKRLASASHDQTVKVWDLERGQPALSLKGHTRPITGVCWSPDGKRLASASGDATVKTWDAESSQETLSLQGHSQPVSSVCWSPDGKRLASAGGDVSNPGKRGEVKVWDVATGHDALSLQEFKSDVRSVSWSPDGKRLATAGHDKTVTVWDAERGQAVLTLQGHTTWVSCVCWSPDGQRLASASNDRTVKVWDVEHRRQTLSLQGHTQFVNCVSWSPDGKRLASASADNKVKVWDAERGQEVLTLEGHTGAVWSVSWSPDGKRLATASNDETVRVWDAERGQELFPLKGHTRQVTSLCWSPDGARLATASYDETVRVWDAERGQEVLALPGHTKRVTSVCWSPDGRRLASAGADGTLCIWDARPRSEDDKVTR